MMPVRPAPMENANLPLTGFSQIIPGLERSTIRIFEVMAEA
jgi:hypothetical protein